MGFPFLSTTTNATNRKEELDNTISKSYLCQIRLQAKLSCFAKETTKFTFQLSILVLTIASIGIIFIKLLGNHVFGSIVIDTNKVKRPFN